MALGFYVADTAMMLLAMLAAVAALGECGRRIIKRWRLLLRACWPASRPRC
jgi:hypothetical protein